MLRGLHLTSSPTNNTHKSSILNSVLYTTFIFLLFLWLASCCAYTMNMFNFYRQRRNSSVGIASIYWLDDWGIGVRVPVISRIFSYPRRPDRLWGPPNLLSNGYRGAVLSPRVKRQGREADHSPPTSAEVKKMWIYTYTPRWSSAWLLKHRDNFTFTIIVHYILHIRIKILPLE
jgi:hypothetical protein